MWIKVGANSFARFTPFRADESAPTVIYGQVLSKKTGFHDSRERASARKSETPIVQNKDGVTICYINPIPAID